MLQFSDNAARDTDMYYHARCAADEENSQVSSSLQKKKSQAGYNSALPDETEINTMDVAELRQTMLNFVRLRKAACSPSNGPDAASDIHARSPSSPLTSSSFASVSSLATSVSAPSAAMPAAHKDATDSPQAHKRHRHDSDTSGSQQRMGIDLLLNASTLSDKMGRYGSPGHHDAYQLPSPPTQPFSPSSTASSWSNMQQHTVLPPISQLAQGCSMMDPRARMSSSSPSLTAVGAHPMSAPPDGAFDIGSVGASSLEAYKISGSTGQQSQSSRCASGFSPAAGACSTSYPPPISATRSQPGLGFGAHYFTPPESHQNSPMGVTPAQTAQGSSSRMGTLPVPSSTSLVLPPTSDTVICPDFHRRQPCPVSPTAALQTARPGQQPSSPPFTFGRAPQTSHHNFYAQAHQLPQQPTLPQQSAQHISVVAPARNVSKPKFNYAFLDTKRPRGPSARWSPEEDALLKRAVKQYGEDRQWVKVAQQVPGRTNLQCRQRWLCNIKAQVEKEQNTAS
ncbi:myb-like DNA-binding protein bas1 [Coemansia asiatica]|nr:myb-like DNA-binding protein bas1 [Coemansia asiatica]